MEQVIPAHDNDTGVGAPAQQVPGSEHYYDKQDNEITKEKAMTRTITN